MLKLCRIEYCFRDYLTAKPDQNFLLQWFGPRFTNPPVVMFKLNGSVVGELDNSDGQFSTDQDAALKLLIRCCGRDSKLPWREPPDWGNLRPLSATELTTIGDEHDAEFDDIKTSGTAI